MKYLLAQVVQACYFPSKEFFSDKASYREDEMFAILPVITEWTLLPLSL